MSPSPTPPPAAPASAPAALSTRSDAELITLAAAGRADAFEAIYDRHAPAAMALARRTVRSRPLAEDVVQEAFLSVWRAAARYRPERGALRGWVLAIVHNRAIDAIRRHGARERRDAGADGLEEHPDARPQTDAEAIRRLDGLAVRSALDELPGTQRAVLESVYFGGLSHTQVAAALKLPLGTVKGRQRLGLKKLREELADSVVA
ncbi:MAG: sigma-70 family RNA polymerase sigma factor [Actinomycetota bacterium]|nr:sigma-70 family RNA polymerase sigma factor [Actinomycetota bacterium]